MRNPKRIDRILGLLKTLWYNWPDGRFVQLIHAHTGAFKNNSDGFYYEDSDLEKDLIAKVEEEIKPLYPVLDANESLNYLTPRQEYDRLVKKMKGMTKEERANILRMYAEMAIWTDGRGPSLAVAYHLINWNKDVENDAR